MFSYKEDEGKVWLTWHDEEGTTTTLCSLTGCIMLERLFEKLGYKKVSDVNLEKHWQKKADAKSLGQFSKTWYKGDKRHRELEIGEDGTVKKIL